MNRHKTRYGSPITPLLAPNTNTPFLCAAPPHPADSVAISVLVPVYDEEESLPGLFTQLLPVLRGLATVRDAGGQ